MGFDSLEIMIKIVSVKKLPCRVRSHEKVQKSNILLRNESKSFVILLQFHYHSYKINFNYHIIVMHLIACFQKIGHIIKSECIILILY